MWSLCFVGLLAPRPRQHGMLHPKLRLTAQEKSNRKRKRSNAFSSATPVFLFKIASALREAHNGSGPATAGAWGRHQPPHRKNLCAGSPNFPSCFSAFFAPFLCPQGHHLGCNILCCRGRGVSSPTNQSPSMKASECRFLKIIFAGFYARKGATWD